MKKAFKKIFGSNGKDDATKKSTSQPGADQRPPAQHQQPHQHQFDYPERHQLEIQQLLAESADKMRRQERQTTGSKPERGVRCPGGHRLFDMRELLLALPCFLPDCVYEIQTQADGSRKASLLPWSR